ncbi:MAG: WD40/YVTN/BNR-like repeat-containing protein [Rudaea sp.]
MKRRSFSHWTIALALGAYMITPALAADSTSWPDPVDNPAEIMPLTAQSLLLGLAHGANGYVAVGGRGDIVLSDDAVNWKQTQVPTRSTLTAVAAVGANVWAVGHDGVIVHSADGGLHWQLQRKDPWHAPADDAPVDPRQGAPLLGVIFTDAKHGFAVGAYSLALRTDDGGAHWREITIAAQPKGGADADTDMDADSSDAAKSGSDQSGNAKMTFSKSQLKIGQEPTPHLNAITRTGSGALFIVGERGASFRSRDDGKTWQRQQLPYDGSMFGVIGFEADHVLAFGLRGHVFESTDLGEHWTQVASGTQLSLMGGTGLPDDGVAIVGANGIVLMRAKGGEPLTSYVDQPAGTITEALPLGDSGNLVLAGENGVSVYNPR